MENMQETSKKVNIESWKYISLFGNIILFIVLNIILYSFLPISGCSISASNLGDGGLICKVVIPLMLTLGVMTVGIIIPIFFYNYIKGFLLIIRIIINIIQGKNITDNSHNSHDNRVNIIIMLIILIVLIILIFFPSLSHIINI